MTPDVPLAMAVISAVAVEYGVALDAILGRRRMRSITLARHAAMWRIRHQLGWSYPRIARRFGVHHTSVMGAVRRVSNDHKRERRLAQMKLYHATREGKHARA